MTPTLEGTMDIPDPATPAGPGHRVRTWLGLGFLGAGLAGHLFAAQAIGGSTLAYRDHIVGFVGLTVVSGAIIAGLGWRFWTGRHDITLLTLGVLQALIGVVIYIERFSVHG